MNLLEAQTTPARSSNGKQVIPYQEKRVQVNCILSRWVNHGTNSRIVLDHLSSYQILFEPATTNGRSKEQTKITRWPPPLPREERKKRQGIPPLERLIAIQDDAPYDIGHAQVGELISFIPIPFTWNEE